MRFVVEIEDGPSPRVRGRAGLDGELARDFTGWLELLRLLEDGIASAAEPPSPQPPAQEDPCEG